MKMPTRRTRPIARHRRTPLTHYLCRAIEAQAKLGKDQRRIAQEIGYDQANMLSMLKAGSTKVPMGRIPALARALNIDPASLFRLALEQYWPNEHGTIAQIFGTLCSSNER